MNVHLEKGVISNSSTHNHC